MLAGLTPGLPLARRPPIVLCSWVAMLCMLGVYLVWHERQRAGTPQQTWHGW